MSHLFTLAYLLTLANWLPISLSMRTLPPSFKRGPLRVLISLSALLAIYEAYMHFIWSASVVAPIRIDVFILMLPLGFLNLAYGITYWRRSRDMELEAEEKSAVRNIAAWCLTVPILAGIGAFGLLGSSRNVTQLLDAGRQFRFEASLRDEQTQTRFYGDLQSKGNSIAGYYRGDGKDDRFSHLVINTDLDIFLFHELLYESKGKLERVDERTYRWKNRGRMETPFEFTLTEIDPTSLNFSGGYGANPTITTTQFHKIDAPRFPLAKSANNEVQFIGVFSTKFDDNGKSFGIYQIWLWRSKNKIWGQYDKRFVERGRMFDFISAQEIEPYCLGSCDKFDLRFRLDHSNIRLQQTSLDSWSIKDEDNVNNPTYQLQRGQIIPAYQFDLAPLSTMEENKHWIKAITTGHFIQWQVPEQIEIIDYTAGLKVK